MLTTNCPTSFPIATLGHETGQPRTINGKCSAYHLKQEICQIEYVLPVAQDIYPIGSNRSNISWDVISNIINILATYNETPKYLTDNCNSLLTMSSPLSFDSLSISTSPSMLGSPIMSPQEIAYPSRPPSPTPIALPKKHSRYYVYDDMAIFNVSKFLILHCSCSCYDVSPG